MNSKSPIEPILIDNRSRGDVPRTDVEQLQFLARMMDSVFEIPGLRVRFGFDAIAGLIPGLGDFATSFVTLYILQEAHRRGVSRLTLARMGGNILIDWLVGSIPLVGDAFDVYWKSNQRNVQLLLKHESDAVNGRRSLGDWAFLIALIVLLVSVLAGSVAISVMLVTALFRWLTAA